MKNGLKDRLFDILNDTNSLPIQDIVVEGRRDIINIYLVEGTRFSVCVENCGNWCVCRI